MNVGFLGPVITPHVHMSGFEVFEHLESSVRAYCRAFPALFERAQGPFLFDVEGRRFIDFLSGAGVLNYGHNDPGMRDALIGYLQDGRIVHGLDLHTVTKADFLRALDAIMLAPRNLSYRVQFTGPTGTNAVEAALKVARKATGRSQIAAFTRGYHGMTLGALSATGSAFKRGGAGISLNNVVRFPFDGFLGPDVDTVDYIAKLLEDPSSGIEPPAAFLVETVQCEGGIRVAGAAWLLKLAELAKAHGSLLIIDDIQAGCGRTGGFFSFDEMGLEPDVICLSKSLSGFGLPMSLVLISPEWDHWQPGEHDGTFRGHNIAFLTATIALKKWEDAGFLAQKRASETYISTASRGLAERFPGIISEVRGRGMLFGLEFADPKIAAKVSRTAFANGLIAETCGPRQEVLKLMPPLITPTDVLSEGFGILDSALAAA